LFVNSKYIGCNWNVAGSWILTHLRIVDHNCFGKFLVQLSGAHEGIGLQEDFALKAIIVCRAQWK